METARRVARSFTGSTSSVLANFLSPSLTPHYHDEPPTQLSLLTSHRPSRSGFCTLSYTYTWDLVSLSPCIWCSLLSRIADNVGAVPVP